jgi:hypothetical protein
VSFQTGQTKGVTKATPVKLDPLLRRCTGDDLTHAKAVEATRVCLLKRSVYVEVMEYSRQQQITANLRLLSSIPIFSKLSGVLPPSSIPVCASLLHDDRRDSCSPPPGLVR